MNFPKSSHFEMDAKAKKKITNFSQVAFLKTDEADRFLFLFFISLKADEATFFLFYFIHLFFVHFNKHKNVDILILTSESNK